MLGIKRKTCKPLRDNVVLGMKQKTCKPLRDNIMLGIKQKNPKTIKYKKFCKLGRCMRKIRIRTM